MTTDVYIPPVVGGQVYDKQGQPLEGLKVALQSAGAEIRAVTTWYGGGFGLTVCDGPGTYELAVGNDMSSALPLQLKEHDRVTVDWDEIPEAPQTPLPLAEIRTVDILWGDGLTFQVKTPWPRAHFRRSVSDGTLTGENEQADWEPPPSRVAISYKWSPTGAMKGWRSITLFSL